MGEKFINRAVNIIVTSTKGPAITHTQDPMPHALLFTLTDRDTGQKVTIDELMYEFLRQNIDREINSHSQYSAIL